MTGASGLGSSSQFCCGDEQTGVNCVSVTTTNRRLDWFDLGRGGAVAAGSLETKVRDVGRGDGAATDQPGKFQVCACPCRTTRVTRN